MLLCSMYTEIIYKYKIISLGRSMGILFNQHLIFLNWLVNSNKKNLRMNLRNSVIWPLRSVILYFFDTALKALLWGNSSEQDNGGSDKSSE